MMALVIYIWVYASEPLFNYRRPYQSRSKMEILVLDGDGGALARTGYIENQIEIQHDCSRLIPIMSKKQAWVIIK